MASFRIEADILNEFQSSIYKEHNQQNHIILNNAMNIWIRREVNFWELEFIFKVINENEGFLFQGY